MTDTTEWGSPHWASVDDALTELTALLRDIVWFQPLDEPRTTKLRSCAVYARDLIDAEQHPRLDDLALVGALDAILDWLIDPQDDARVQRLRSAYAIYSDFYDMADET